MDMLLYNSPIFSKALNIYVDETIQADSNMTPLGVEAKNPELEKEILNLFDKININSLLHSITTDIVQYGDACIIPTLTNEGVMDIVQIDPREMQRRFEFIPSEINQKLNGTIKTKFNSMYMMNDYIEEIEKLDNFSNFFKSFLFGFQVSDVLIAPWKMIHFRNLTSKKPFAPFGMPLLIGSIAPYRQFDSAMTLQMTARGASIPIDHYKLFTEPGMPPTQKLSKVEELLSGLNNAGYFRGNTDETGIGEKIISIEGLFEYDQISPSIDFLSNFRDIETLRDDLILSTNVPRGYYDPDNGSFGNTGAPLIQQFKPFARAVFKVQQILLTGLSDLIKTHLILINKYDEIEDFALTMPFPESQTNSDHITSQNDLLGLANDILDNLADKFADGGSASDLPKELIKQIYTQILPYDSSRINDWVEQIINKSTETEDTEAIAEQRIKIIEPRIRKVLEWKVIQKETTTIQKNCF